MENVKRETSEMRKETETPIYFEDSTIRVERQQDKGQIEHEIRFTIQDESPGTLSSLPDPDRDNKEFYQKNEPTQYDLYSDVMQYSFQQGVGKAFAKAVETNEIMKIKEKSVVSHRSTDMGFVRTRQFADGVQTIFPLTRNRIEGCIKWCYRGEVYFSLIVKEVNGGRIYRCPVYNKQNVFSDDFVEAFLTRFLIPIDTRAYSKTAQKDLRAEILQHIAEGQKASLQEHSGWFFEPVTNFFRGENYPLSNSVMAALRVPCQEHHTIEEYNALVKEVASELRVNNTFSFLLSCGLLSWLGCFVGDGSNKVPDILFAGNLRAGLEVADTFLKIYSAGDNIDVVESSKTKQIDEYLDVFRGDYMLIPIDETKKKSMQMLQKVISYGTRKERAPLAVLVTWPENLYEKYVCLDTMGIQLSEKLKSNIRDLKSLVIGVIESLNIKPDSDKKDASLDEIIKTVVFKIADYFIEYGLDPKVCKDFSTQLLCGLKVLREQPQFPEDWPLFLFRQRMQYYVNQHLVNKAEVQVAGNLLEVKGDRCLISSDYFHNNILPGLRINKSQWKIIRNLLIPYGFLDVYQNDGKEFSKQITTATGKRIRVLDFDNKFLRIGREED